MQVSTVRPASPTSTDWQTKVNELVLEARQDAPGSFKRNQCLTQIIRLVSPKLWKFYTPHYADALQQTWLYFAKNICTTYDPERASVVTWLNHYLRYRHQDFVNQALTRQNREMPLEIESSDRESFYMIEISSCEYGSLSLLQDVVAWVKADPTGELRSTHIKNRPDINCQALLLLRLPPETPWKDISARSGVTIPTLSSFYRRNCQPYLQKLQAQSEFAIYVSAQN